MSARRPEVVDVDVARTEGVTVSWDDGTVGRFDLTELRQACPCAACRGLRDRGQAAWPRPGDATTIGIADAELVGSWGISFTWSDGHGTGIYPWDSLRDWTDALAARDGGAPPAGDSVPPPA